jgi:hypothetical protein
MSSVNDILDALNTDLAAMNKRFDDSMPVKKTSPRATLNPRLPKVESHIKIMGGGARTPSPPVALSTLNIK